MNKLALVLCCFLYSLYSLYPLFSMSALATGIDEGLTDPQKGLFHDVSKDLRCPTCTGLSILESDAQFSIQMKTAVREQILAGKSQNEIMQYFTERYGLWILREPQKSVFNSLAWILTISAMIFGPLAICLLIWRRKREVINQGIRSTEEILRELDTLVSKEKGTV